MPWMCLERCGANSTDIQNNLAQLKQLSPYITKVAFEEFNLGPNGTFVVNYLTHVTPQVSSLKLLHKAKC